MIEKNRQEKKTIIAEAILVTILCFLFVNRLIRGAETTDESFYATLAYRLCNGNHLFNDMWEQCSTSAVFPAFLLKLYMLITGNTDGCILLFRIAYFVMNILLAILGTYVFKEYVSSKWAILISAYFCFYAPFHLYTFSYNNQADYLSLLMSLLLLLAAEKKDKRLYFLAGIDCACLVMSYPTLIILCPIIVIAIWLRRKHVPKGWLLFAAGGLSVAAIIVIILLLTIGYQGIINGVNGILSDPAYGSVSVSMGVKLINAFNHLFEMVSENEKFLMKAYIILLGFVFYIKDKYPYSKMLIIIYPFIVWLQIYPASSLYAFGTGTFAFYLAVFAPVLMLFLNDAKHKSIMKKLLYFIWLPSLLLYIVIALSSYGGAKQGAQGLAAGGLVTLIGIVFVIKEVFSNRQPSIFTNNMKLAEILTAAILTGTLLLEISVYYGYIFRDAAIKDLNTQVEYGPYKGIYTTAARKGYLENMTDLMQKIEKDDERACILYHSNFAYLMLDSKAAAPTTWGLYADLDNEDVFIKYFAQEEEHIPDAVYIVDVPNEYTTIYDSQQSHAYQYCNDLKAYISNYYTLDIAEVIEESGKVEKYTLTQSKGEVLKALRNKVSEWPAEKQNPLYQIPLYRILRNETKDWF